MSCISTESVCRSVTSVASTPVVDFDDGSNDVLIAHIAPGIRWRRDMAGSFSLTAVTAVVVFDSGIARHEEYERRQSMPPREARCCDCSMGHFHMQENLETTGIGPCAACAGLCFGVSRETNIERMHCIMVSSVLSRLLDPSCP